MNNFKFQIGTLVKVQRRLPRIPDMANNGFVQCLKYFPDGSWTNADGSINFTNITENTIDIPHEAIGFIVKDTGNTDLLVVCFPDIPTTVWISRESLGRLNEAPKMLG